MICNDYVYFAKDFFEVEPFGQNCELITGMHVFPPSVVALLGR